MKKAPENTVWVRTTDDTSLAMTAAEARWLGEALLSAARVAEGQHGDARGALFVVRHPDGEAQRCAMALARAEMMLKQTGGAE